MIKEEEKKESIFGILAIVAALIQYLWAVLVTVYFKRKGILEYVSSPDGYLPLFFSNLILALPMVFVFIITIVKYRRNFEDEMDYVKTDRYLLTLILTTIYSFMLPFAAVNVTPATHGAYAWFYYLFLISFFEEFLYRSLIPNYMERSTFPKVLVYTLPALLYGLYQTALPLSRSGFSLSSLMESLPDVLFSIALHYLLLALKKWSGAMWLPIITHAILDFGIYLIFR